MISDAISDNFMVIIIMMMISGAYIIIYEYAGHVIFGQMPNFNEINVDDSFSVG